MVVSILTGGLSSVLGPGTTYECEITDTETGRTATGSGFSKSEASDEAFRELKEQESSCFLTTACVVHKGLDDNCDQLEILRRFRDTYVHSLPGGSELIEEYYDIAPKIVARIDASPSREKTLDWLYSKIEEVVELIKEGQNHEALVQYCSVVKELRK
ncbi:MAG: hypothetical protein F6K42_36455 [Leptolyngbya sp. SIO1D8]|nr:hypothetical protein [Leptolyngbya sp. SIO1D8]